jgi:O-antigen/teichoic acid export membrane protein
MTAEGKLDVAAMPSAPEDAVDRTPLKRRVLNAGAWSLTGYAAGQVIRFGSNLLMTRLLVPEMFGVMAIATLVMAALQMFSDVGLKLNIIQSKRGSDPGFLDTAWSIQIVRGVLLFIVALAFAIAIHASQRVGSIGGKTVYADPVLPYVVGTLSIGALFAGISSTKLAEAGRNLALAQVTKLELLSQVAGLVCMLLWVAIDRSIWALVAGNICGGLVMTVASHLWLPGHRNRWRWDRAAVHEIIHFGKWIFLSSILGFLVNNGDRLLLGGMVSAATLGAYVIAFMIFSAVDAVLSKIISDISFPALSEIARERPEALKATYYRIHLVLACVGYFCAGVLMISGQALIHLLYDARYADAGWMLQILAVALLSIPLRTVTQCFMALGMPRLFSNIIAVRLAALMIAIPLGFHFFGLPGAVWGIALSQLSYIPSLIFYSIKNSLFDLRRELLPLPMVFIGMAVAKLITAALGF